MRKVERPPKQTIGETVVWRETVCNPHCRLNLLNVVYLASPFVGERPVNMTPRDKTKGLIDVGVYYVSRLLQTMRNIVSYY